jgi:tRNA G18 (ribose-2'-O)-methylase SpoU
MKPRFSFTERKFKDLSPEQQHKKCFELLKEMYMQMLSWMNIQREEPATLEQVANLYHYHRIKAHISLKEHNLLPAVKKGDNLTAEEFLPIDIYLDRLRSMHNIGAIIRTTEAFRLGSIFLSEDTLSSDQKLEKTAMGTQELVSMHEHSSLETLKRPIIAVETISEAIPFYDFTFPDSFTLVLGNEELGCSEKTLQLADHYIQIPLYGKKNSLNVASAFAILAGEISRQKRASKYKKR